VALTDEEFLDWVGAQAERVETRLQDAVRAEYIFVEEVARYLTDLGGKRFRPSLVIAAAGLGLDTGTVNEEGMLRSAVVVELTHVASLYHDDVMDEAQLRRGAPTAHVKWSNSVAIMVGDFLLAQVSRLAARLGEAFMVFQGETLARLVQGQVAELRGPAVGQDPIDHHLYVLSHKTGSLIAASARYGGMFAGLAPDQVEALTQYGERLGMAFQLADDLIDLVSEQSGKQLGTDLREGVPTLVPLLVKRQRRPEDARLLELLDTPVAESDLPEALALLRANPALDQAQAEIRRWSDAALACLTGFPDGAPLRALRTLCDQAVQRSH
jgi:heptaprenyl diphosphate synthase